MLAERMMQRSNGLGKYLGEADLFDVGGKGEGIQSWIPDSTLATRWYDLLVTRETDGKNCEFSWVILSLRFLQIC